MEMGLEIIKIMTLLVVMSLNFFPTLLSVVFPSCCCFRMWLLQTQPKESFSTHRTSVCLSHYPFVVTFWPQCTPLVPFAFSSRSVPLRLSFPRAPALLFHAFPTGCLSCPGSSSSETVCSPLWLHSVIAQLHSFGVVRAWRHSQCPLRSLRSRSNGSFAWPPPGQRLQSFPPTFLQLIFSNVVEKKLFAVRHYGSAR